MNIWNCDNWEKVYKGNNIRNGLRLRFDVNADEEVKLALKDFAKHLFHGAEGQVQRKALSRLS